MGCASSKKKTISITPAADSSVGIPESRRFRDATATQPDASSDGRKEENESDKSAASSRSLRLRNLRRQLEGEQVAAGWPAWLSSVAGEAIHGWVPLKADSFEKLEKIGQGTYSSVFRARDLETGKIVALKKVRFDNFEPESVRFMAREIQILRKLNHPNVMKLEGLITSKLSCMLYLVFEYMDHDLAGLSSSPDINLTEAQVKCYMKQLLSGLEHCHSRNIIHRDIKGANLLVSNDGVLKIADFGLANTVDPSLCLPLTSRVVTLWYRPPELLLGSTHYDAAVDLWSVGCVFAEMFLKKPILQGRTEVEQLHKIFKLCGSPPEEYWKKSRLPHATIFKPHQPYQGCIQEALKAVPDNASDLLRTFLSVEPYKRGTASTALTSEYFCTKPCAFEPSSLPKYPPTKEIDAKMREEAQRRNNAGRVRKQEGTRRASRLSRASCDISKVDHKTECKEESKKMPTVDDKKEAKQDFPRANTKLFVEPPTTHHKNCARHTKKSFQEDMSFSGPLIIPSSSGFAWAKTQKEDRASVKAHKRSNSRSHLSSNTNQENKSLDTGPQSRSNSKHHEPREVAKKALLKKWSQLEQPDSFNSCEVYSSKDLSDSISLGDVISSKHVPDMQGQDERVEFSGPLLSQSHDVDELLQKHERQIRQAVRKSWFQRVTGKKQGR